MNPKDFPTTQGIYKIVNSRNKRVYIGSTVNFQNRFAQHLKMLREGNHHCKQLQNDWDLYGEECFTFKVAEVVDDKTVLLDVEKEHIHQYKRPYNKKDRLNWDYNPNYTIEQRLLINQKRAERNQKLMPTHRDWWR